MARQKILPGRGISGAITLPGDKSISHRYAILAALAEGHCEIENYSTAADCRSTLDCLKRLGIEVDSGDSKVQIRGKGLHGLKKPWRTLDADNSGTTMRLLTGMLAGQSFDSTLTGDSSLRRRPMRRVMDPLRQMGAQISASEGQFAPLEIRGCPLKSISYSMPIPSAQVKSAVLLAGLFAEGETSVTESIQSRDHTEIALREFGAETTQTANCVGVKGGGRLQPRHVVVPGDISSAVFFLAAACILPSSNLLVRGVGLNPTRTAVLDFLASQGAPVSLVSVESRAGELHGDIAIRPSQLTGGVISGEASAAMIDELPMLAAIGPFTEKGIEIRDAKELRIKESDRIAAVAQNLRAMGAEVEELPDGLRVAGGMAGKLRGARIEPHGDHRIAMAFAIAALGAQGESVMEGSECVAVSFPEFFSALDRLIER
ncbi:MAG: 3-phosphoshikimate 1-carboxyvinyltransferase [Acidobacteria bacterium]|nr:3-phosphoshikimate 1-carboxyvinyltransferase [Acidobacteriota bacterium]